MKHGLPILTLVVLPALVSLTAATSELPEPGPEAAGMRMRLAVTPHPESDKEGYDLQVDLISVSQEPTLLRANEWRSWRHEGSFQEFLEPAVSIETDPAIERYVGQVARPLLGITAAEPEYTLQPGETLSVKWHTMGRHLKNSVTNPFEVQNPELKEAGLYSVHASIVLTVAGRPVRLRSNEQLVPTGGSRETPKHTYGPVVRADETTMTAMLGLGALDKISLGEQFVIRSGLKDVVWTLTITNVAPSFCFGTLEPPRVKVNPMPAFPTRGAYAALIPKK